MSYDRMGPPRTPRRGFGVFVTVLVLLFGGVAAWQGGALSLFRGKGDVAVAEPRTSPAGVVTSSPSPSSPSSSPSPAPAVVPGFTDAEVAALDGIAATGLPVRCGGGTKPLVALTFDDGPGPYTEQAMTILQDAGVKATFFLVGKKFTDEAEWDALLPDEVAAGAVGDHTWNHVYLPGSSQETLDKEVGATMDAIEQATGSPVRLFRPPYGAHDPDLDAYVESLGMVQVLWSIDSTDSAGATAEEVYANVMAFVGPGSIVLLHENRGTTLSVLPQLLAAIKDKGLQPVTVPELLVQDPPSLSQLETGDCGGHDSAHPEATGSPSQ